MPEARFEILVPTPPVLVLISGRFAKRPGGSWWKEGTSVDLAAPICSHTARAFVEGATPGRESSGHPGIETSRRPDSGIARHRDIETSNRDPVRREKMARTG